MIGKFECCLVQDRSQRDVGILDGRWYASLVESEPGVLGIDHYGSHHELRRTTMVFLAALQQYENHFGLLLSEILPTSIIPCREQKVLYRLVPDRGRRLPEGRRV